MIRAYIREDLPSLSLAVYLVDQQDGERPSRILRIIEGGDATAVQWADLPTERFDVEPTLRIGDSEARALLEALAGHYGGTTDMRTLRADLDYERRRVDELIALMGAVITNGMRRPPRRPPEALMRKLTENQP
ncbi:hypothetical protein [Actinomadura decatromicini]|uniref:Uncharacterized protein n=1 Tax=Actinomadura decatromicini TaxID=2604572 RepID=A0A5D3FAR1_9ACTN|nr:hypothetical protein [Actinomadura decatromicini]TYK45169.1 hypothetical protein FXF68_31315 [Actinomadura decatromicini]